MTMLRKIFNNLSAPIAASWDRKVSAVPLGLFRICICSIILCEALYIFYFRELIFDPMPSLFSHETNMLPMFFIWFAALIFMIIGLYFHVAAFVNYIIILMTFSVFRDYEYHIDYVYIGLSFSFLWLPVHKALSIDAKRFSNIQKIKIREFYYPYLLTLGVGLLYFDSALHKLGSSLWLSGIGFWLPASTPPATWLDLSFILNNKFISYFLGYVTIIFELFFIFLIWSPRIRPYLFVGIILHIGIFFAFPIPLFALASSSFYLLTLKPSLFNFESKEGNNYNSKFQWLNCFQVKWSYKFLRKIVFLQKQIFVSLIFMLFIIQLSFLPKTPLAKPILNNLFGEKITQQIIVIQRYSFGWLKPITGITTHALFMDNHFERCPRTISLSYTENKKERFLPLATKQGQMSMLNSGRLWADWIFRTTCLPFNNPRFEHGIERRIRFWKKRGYEFAKENYTMWALPIYKFEGWKENMLKKQLNNKPVKIAEITILNNGATFSYTENAEKFDLSVQHEAPF
jgi:hypothetical protein